MNKDTLRRKIINLLDEKDVEGLFKAYDEYEKNFSVDLFYYLSYSDALLLLDDFESILNLMDEALEHGFDNSMVYERKADAFHGLHRYSDAIEWYLKCDVDSDSKDILHVLFMLGLCYKELHSYDQAITYFEDVLLDYEDYVPALVYCGLCYVYTDNLRRGREYLDQSICLDCSVLSEICEGLMDSNDSVFLPYLNQLKDDDLREELATQHYCDNKNYSSALVYWESFTERHPFVHNKSYLARLYELNGQNHLSKVIYQSILDEKEEDSSLYYSIEAHLEAYRHLDNHQYLNYVKNHWNLIQTIPNIYFVFFEFLIKMHDKELVSDMFTLDIVSSFKNSEKEHYTRMRASYYIMVREYLDAIHYLLSIKPEECSIYYKTLVTAYFYHGDYQNVLDIYEKGMPNGLIAYMVYMSMSRLGQEEQANDFLYAFCQKILDDEPIEDIDVFLGFVEDLMLFSKEDME